MDTLPTENNSVTDGTVTNEEDEVRIKESQPNISKKPSDYC
jgi:hypothetical protein